MEIVFHLGLQNHWGQWLQTWKQNKQTNKNKKNPTLVPGKKSYDKPRYNVLKSRDITLLTKAKLVFVFAFFFLSFLPQWICMIVHLGWPYISWLSFTKLDKTVAYVMDWLIFCDCGSVCVSTYHLTGVSLTLGVEYLFVAATTKHSHCSLSWMWNMSSRPLAAPAPCSHSSLLQTLLKT